MTDVYKASVRLGASAEQSGTLSPDPWHFSLCANSMIQEQGDAAVMPASPMPLDCCGARGACQQSPILRSSNPSLPGTLAAGKGQGELFYHAIGPKRKMPGVWGQSPQEPTGEQRPSAPGMTPRVRTFTVWPRVAAGVGAT
jgi:hypothetical protein